MFKEINNEIRSLEKDIILLEKLEKTCDQGYIIEEIKELRERIGTILKYN